MKGGLGFEGKVYITNPYMNILKSWHLGIEGIVALGVEVLCSTIAVYRLLS